MAGDLYKRIAALEASVTGTVAIRIVRVVADDRKPLLAATVGDCLTVHRRYTDETESDFLDRIAPTGGIVFAAADCHS